MLTHRVIKRASFERILLIPFEIFFDTIVVLIIISMIRRFDLLQGSLHALNDFRMIVVEVVGFAEIFIQIVQLHGGISRLGLRPGKFAAKLAVSTIPLPLDEFPLAGPKG